MPLLGLAKKLLGQLASWGRVRLQAARCWRVAAEFINSLVDRDDNNDGSEGSDHCAQ